MNNKTAVIVVSFGTTHLDALENSISATEGTIASHLPDLRVYRAFTSRIVIRRLKENYGISVDNLAQALERVWSDGFENAIIQPTLILGGIEYDFLCRTAQDYRKLNTSIGKPLIMDKGDCETVAHIIMRGNYLKDDEALVLMGHGTTHESNAFYHQMQSVYDRGGYRAYICTVEGEPSFEDVVERLESGRVRRAKLLPLMFVAGDHAKNDMAGQDENSLLSIVTSAKIEAETIICGLGENADIQKLYAEEAAAALRRLVL